MALAAQPASLVPSGNTVTAMALSAGRLHHYTNCRPAFAPIRPGRKFAAAATPV
jgi:hypothetical protein